MNQRSGQLITPFEGNPEKGFVVVQSTEKQFNGGWINNRTRTSTIKGDLADLESLGLKEGEELKGKIQVLESLEPSWEGQEPKINPNHATVETDDDGNVMEYGEDAVLRVNDQPIYRNTVYTTDETAEDVFLQHTNVQVNVEQKV